jgi:hypothetical protein
LTPITRAAIALVLLFLIGWGVRASWPSGELRDYGSFIGSGRNAAAGENPYGINPITFHVVLPGFEVWNPNLNPPVSIPVFRFFDRVPPQRGFVWWFIFSLTTYVAAVVLLARRYGAGPSGLTVLWALALAGFWDTLALGQIYLPLVLAAVAGWLLLERRRDVAAGVMIGLVVAIKPNFAVWPMLLLLARHYRPATTAIVTAIVISLLPLMSYGVEIYRQWFALILSDRNRAEFLTNASINGLAQRAHAGSLGILCSVGLVMALAWWAFVTRPHRLRATALGILAGIAASPIAWVHYTLFLLPLFFTAGWAPRVIVVAGALLVVPVPLLLRALDAPLWLQLTAGSAYNWAVLLCLALQSRSPGTRHLGLNR